MQKSGILQRYLLREAAGAWVAVTLVLLSIMLATRFARYLAVAASGKLPKELLLEVVGLSSLQYLMILIPVSLLLAIMLSLGRLYKDQEMTSMMACGAGSWRFYRDRAVEPAVPDDPDPGVAPAGDHAVARAAVQGPGDDVDDGLRRRQLALLPRSGCRACSA